MAAVKDALDPSWINKPDPDGPGPSYDAEELRRLQGYQLAGGATAGSSRTGILNPRDLALSLSGSNVLVGAGGAVIGTAKGAYVAGVTASTTIGALVAADVTNPRRDRVVLEILDPDNGGTAGRKAQLRIIDGTPNASAATGAGYPAEPVLAITLGYVDVPKSGAGSPSITALPPITAMAGAPIPVRSQAEADALPKWNGALRIRLDLPSRPLQSCNGTVWKHQGPPTRTDFNVSGLGNAVGTLSRILATMPMGSVPYARIIKLHARMAISPASISSGVSTIYAAVSLMQSVVNNSQGLTPMSWTAPGAYLQSAYVNTPEILVPAGVDPLARMWVYVASGNINTTVSSDARITQFWAEEWPADA